MPYARLERPAKMQEYAFVDMGLETVLEPRSQALNSSVLAFFDDLKNLLKNDRVYGRVQ